VSDKEYRLATAAQSGLLYIRGVPGVALGDRVTVRDQTGRRRNGQVIRTSEELVLIQVLEGTDNLDLERTWVRFLDQPFEIALSPDLRQRVRPDRRPWRRGHADDLRPRSGHCQSKFYTACSRTGAGWSFTVFAHESPTGPDGFDAENGLYLFALTVPALASWIVATIAEAVTGRCAASGADRRDLTRLLAKPA